MVRYLVCTYHGTSDKFAKNQLHQLAVKTRWWSKKVSMYQRHGYYDEMMLGTLRHYPSWEKFTSNWEIIKEG